MAATVIFTSSVTISKIFTVEMCNDLDLDLYNWSKSNVDMPIEIPHMNCCSMSIVIDTLYVTISKIFIVEISMTLTLSFRMGQAET